MCIQQKSLYIVLEVITGQRDGNLEQLYINYKKSHHQRWLQTEDKNKAHDSTDGKSIFCFNLIIYLLFVTIINCDELLLYI